ncbi:MAG: NifB/NifX family molybdenum-iron cluster-binding protein [Kiritimatiellia bacterium]|nr:NifB/NifX family molybdenum-iron cluster-binding protein [Lentisphaerota bacterium]
MKIAITSSGKNMTDMLDTRFGRAKYFIVVDTETGKGEAHDNQQNLNAAQGAGIQAAQAVANLGVAAVISGNLGPKAFQTLQAADIKMYLCDQVPVAEAVQRFQAGELKDLQSANVAGHW